MPGQRPSEPSPEAFSQSLERLKTESQAVKAKIETEKRRRDLPLDSSLGNPESEEAAADGRLDLPEGDDDQLRPPTDMGSRRRA